MVKHWFRNTLFKERQRNKDSPYNFNNPPSTTLNLEEYERTGQAKVTTLGSDLKLSESNLRLHKQQQQHAQQFKDNEMLLDQCNSRPVSHPSSIASADNMDLQHAIKTESTDDFMGSIADAMKEQSLALQKRLQEEQQANQQQQQQAQQQAQQQKHLQQSKNFIDHHHFQTSLMENDGNNQNHHQNMYYSSSETKSESGSSEILSRPPTPNSSSYSNISDIINQQIENIPINNITNNLSGGGHLSEGSLCSRNIDPSKKFQLNTIYDKNSDANSLALNATISSGKRANRTRFTDYQIKVLQEFFENNSYPKDSDLEYLSKLLLLSPRVIVVWFQVSHTYIFILFSLFSCCSFFFLNSNISNFDSI